MPFLCIAFSSNSKHNLHHYIEASTLENWIIETMCPYARKLVIFGIGPSQYFSTDLFKIVWVEKLRLHPIMLWRLARLLEIIYDDRVE